jgi:hypothetical protein
MRCPRGPIVPEEMSASKKVLRIPSSSLAKSALFSWNMEFSQTVYSMDMRNVKETLANIATSQEQLQKQQEQLQKQQERSQKLMDQLRERQEAFQLQQQKLTDQLRERQELFQLHQDKSQRLLNDLIGYNQNRDRDFDISACTAMYRCLSRAFRNSTLIFERIFFSN